MHSRNEDLPLAVEIERTEERLHVIDGLVRAMQDPRAVLDMILAAGDVDAARGALRTQLGLDEIQVSAVLDMQFRRATKQDRRKIEEHRQEVADHVRFLRTLGEQSPD